MSLNSRMFNRKKNHLTAKTIETRCLKEQEVSEMYQLFESFYDNVSLKIFTQDLYKKDKVILMKNHFREIKGFSTLQEFTEFSEGRPYHIIYSGDTIIHPDYWGTSVLTMEFLKNILLIKVKNPLRPVWWLLLSKGFKTYLLLANNFIIYYPRHTKETPEKYKLLMHQIAEKLFPGTLNPATSTLHFTEGTHEKLKASLAPIDSGMLKKHPKINFFYQANPGWESGDELLCLGKVNWLLGIYHPTSVVFKRGRRFFNKKIKLRGAN